MFECSQMEQLPPQYKEGDAVQYDPPDDDPDEPRTRYWICCREFRNGKWRYKLKDRPKEQPGRTRVFLNGGEWFAEEDLLFY